MRIHAYPTLLIQQIQYTQLVFDKIDTWLIIVKFNHIPNDSLFEVLFLFQFEHMLIELLLQLLVGIINRKLFEGITDKCLKTVNVQDADETMLLSTTCQTLIDNVHDVLEQFGIDMLGQSITCSLGGRQIHRY